jgi:hypothetical protein
LKYIKVTRIVIAQMIGNVEDEWCFFYIILHESKLCNNLIDDLYLVMHMFAQKFFTLESFPYHEAILAWKKERNGLFIIYE